MRVPLDGEWLLYFAPVIEDVDRPEELESSRLSQISAEVPGNVELDLSKAGVLPHDLYHGANILKVRQFEDFAWWYVRDFILSHDEVSSSPKWLVRFEGVDTIAEYWLNGQCLGHSSNALIDHEFDVTPLLITGANRIAVHLRPCREFSWNQRIAPLWSGGQVGTEESHWVRKAPHTYGWDIMPRAVSAGLWRSVWLESVPKYRIRHIYVATRAITSAEAFILLTYALDVPYPLRPNSEELAIRISIQSPDGVEVVRLVRQVTFPSGMMSLAIPHPQLWWPVGFGDPILYQWKAELVNRGLVFDERHGNLGIRTAKVVYADPATDTGGDFGIVINDVSIPVRGANWGPIDAFHSRDSQGYTDRLQTLRDIGCNLVRIWGGGVYPDTILYDFCDTNGIMVWQDFAMACALYPQSSVFEEMMRLEVEAVTQRLANHPSLILWCGDNEVDEYAWKIGIPPSVNRLTREVIPSFLRQNDPYRPFVPSSPYISQRIEERGTLEETPEQHLWGPRDYFKSNFYTTYRGAFVSEIGFMGLTFLSSMERFLSADALWPPTNDEWLVHATDPTVDRTSMYWTRAQKTFDRVREYFSPLTDRQNDVILASQIVQAEGYKFAIEWARQSRKRGIVWWSLFDGWPQPTSDAVLDYYLQKKLAYYYIARSQRVVLALAGEPVNGKSEYPIWMSNQGGIEWNGIVEIVDGDSDNADTPIWRGEVRAPAGELCGVTTVPVKAAPHLMILRWFSPTKEAGACTNHYITDHPPIDLLRCRAWLPRILGEGDYREFMAAWSRALSTQ